MSVKKRVGEASSQPVQPGEAIERAKTSTRLISEMIGADAAQSIREAIGPGKGDPEGSAPLSTEEPAAAPSPDASVTSSVAGHARGEELHVDLLEGVRDVVDRLEALRDIPERLDKIEAALTELSSRLTEDD